MRYSIFFLQVVFEMQPRDTGAQAGGGATKEETVWLYLLSYFLRNHVNITKCITLCL